MFPGFLPFLVPIASINMLLFAVGSGITLVLLVGGLVSITEKLVR
jgi:hypothetical protein